MLVISFILIGVLLITVQTTVFMLSPVWLMAPDFYFILVAFLAYRMDLFRSLIILFPLSCLLDVFSGIMPGTYTLLCFGGFFQLRLMAQKMPVNESLYQVPLIGVSYLAISWVVYIFLSFLDSTALVPWSWPKMLIRAGLVMLFAPLLFKIFTWLNKRMQRSFLPMRKLKVRSGNVYRRK